MAIRAPDGANKVKCKVSQDLSFEIKIIIKKSRLKHFENIDGNVIIWTFVNNLVISQNKKEIYICLSANDCSIHATYIWLLMILLQ